MSPLIFWWKTYPLYFQGQSILTLKSYIRETFTSQRSYCPSPLLTLSGLQHCHSSPTGQLQSDGFSSGNQIVLVFFSPMSCIATNQKKKYAFCWKAHLLSQQEANSQAIWWISHTTSYVDIRDFWVQKQTPQKSKDFWLKMGAIRWSIFLERPLNASVTQNTSSWMIHQMEVLRSYRIPFWNFSSLPSPCLGMTNISLSWWNPGQPDWYTAPVSQQGLWTEPNCLNSFLSLRS